MVGQAGDQMAAHSTGINSFKVCEICGVVEGEAVPGDPAFGCNTNRDNFSTFKPYARIPFVSLAL